MAQKQPNSRISQAFLKARPPARIRPCPAHAPTQSPPCPLSLTLNSRPSPKIGSIPTGTCDVGGLRGVKGQTHDSAGHLHHRGRLPGIQATTVQVPGTHERLQGAPVSIVQPARGAPEPTCPHCWGASPTCLTAQAVSCVPVTFHIPWHLEKG